MKEKVTKSRNILKPIIIVLIIILAIVGIFYVLNKNKAKNEAQTAVAAQKNASVSVRADTVKYTVLNNEYAVNGVFEAKQTVDIAAQSSGRVIRLTVDEGDYVRAGQTLAIIESDKQNVNVSNAQANYNNAKAEVERFENAFASGGVTRQQLDQMKLQLETARNNLRGANISASDVNVKASFPGIINSKSIEPGSYVNPGQQMFNIVNVSTLKLRVNVDEKNIGALRNGQRIKVIASVLPEKSWEGVITFMAPIADASLNFPIELEITNNTRDLKAGMYGTAVFGAGKNISALVVSSAAFVGNVSSNEIFVIKDNKAVLTKVISGRNFGDRVEILSGLKEGDVVVTSGQINLANETPVQVIN